MGVLLYREQIGCGIAAVKGAKCVGMLMYREQIYFMIADVKEANCVWDCCCTRSKFGVVVLL